MMITKRLCTIKEAYTQPVEKKYYCKPTSSHRKVHYLNYDTYKSYFYNINNSVFKKIWIVNQEIQLLFENIETV